MGLVYSLGTIIGYHFVYFIFVVVAVLISKKIGALGWIVYAIGTILEALSLIGNYNRLRYFGRTNATFALIAIVGIIIAIVAAFIISANASGATKTSKSSIKKLQQELEDEQSE